MSSVAHTAAHSPEEIKKHVKVYVSVFAALAFLTVVTVAVSYLQLPIIPAVVVALIIASIKGGLVACYFMHLISEKKLIYAVLVLCAVFFVTLMSLPSLTSMPHAFHVG